MLPIAAILTQYTITGYDASAHLSEETKSAADAAAKGIWRSIFYSAIGGWILLLAFLFAVQDADEVSAGGGAVVDDLHPGDDSNWVGIVLLISTAGQFFCTMACMTSASRMLFAFSRDRAVPGPPAVVDAEHEPGARQRRHPLRGRSRRSSPCPRWSRSTSTAHPVPVAFFAVVSIGVVGLYLCFAIPIFLRWRQGDAFKVGSWNLRRTLQVDGARSRSIEIVITSIIALFPTSPGGVPWDDELRVEVRQLHPAAGRRRADPAVDLLARVGEEVVHRARSSRSTRPADSWRASLTAPRPTMRRDRAPRGRVELSVWSHRRGATRRPNA